MAQALAENGFDVAVHYHGSAAEAEEVRDEIAAIGRRAILLRADLADEAEVERLIPDAESQFGPLGVLINNASRFEREDWPDVTRQAGTAISSQICAHRLCSPRRSLGCYRRRRAA